MERMQFQKQRGNVSGENDYVNLETKADSSIREAMGSNSGGESTNNTNKIAMRYNKGQNTKRKKRTARTSSQLPQFCGCFWQIFNTSIK
jgi:hypothetical protein